MVSVVKQRRQFQNTQIGINRADMSVANDLGRVSQLADQITNRMFREAADNAAKSAKQFIDEMPNNAIYGVDPKTGRPKVIDFQESLPSKGYGTYAQDLIKKGIDERFTRLATNEYKEKSAEFASKYPFSPTKYKEEMSRFVSEMKKPYSGKYANLIEIGATEWIGRTQAVILENAIKNQRRLAGLDLSNSLNDFSKDIASIGIGGGTDSKQMLAMIDEYVSSNSEAIASMRNMGNFRQTPKQVADALKAEFAVNRIMHIFERTTRTDPKGLNGAKFIDAVLVGRFDFPEEFNVSKEETKLLYNHVVKGGQQSALRTKLIGLQEDNQRVRRSQDAIKIEEDRNKADAQLSQILFDKEQIKDNYDPTIENNAYNQFVSNIAPMDLKSAVGLYLDEIEKINEATTLQEIAGSVTPRAILNPTEANNIKNELTDVFRNHVGDQIVSVFGRDKIKLEAVGEFINMTNLPDGKLNMAPFIERGINLSQTERKALQQFGQFNESADPRASMYENWGGDNRVRLTNSLRAEINKEIAERQGFIETPSPISEAKRRKLIDFNEGMLTGFTSTTKDQREILEDSLLSDPTYGAELAQIGVMGALRDARFMTPGGEFYKFYEDLNANLVNKNILPQSAVMFMQGMENGSISAGEGRYMLNFIRANILRPIDQRNIVADQLIEKTLPNGRKILAPDTGALSTTTTRLNLFKRGHGLDGQANFFAEFIRSSQAFGTDALPALFAKAVELRNDSSRKEDVLNDLRNKFELKSNQDPIAHGRRILSKIAGGQNNPLYNMLKDSIDEWAVINFNNKGASFEDWVENIKDTSFGGSDDIVLDINGVISTNNPKDIRTPYSPQRLFGDKSEQFKLWADSLIRDQTNNIFSLTSGDRGGFTQSKGLLSTVFGGFKPMKAGDPHTKVWLVPDPYTSMMPTGEPDLATTIFRPHYINDLGELVPALFFDASAEKGKEIIYPEIKVSDFLQFSRSDQMRRYN